MKSPATSEPAWDIARLFPDQGTWSEGDYLLLQGNHFVEFSDGLVEVLPMPSELHQSIVISLLRLFLAFVTPQGLGKLLTAPFRVKLRPGKFREPDLMFMFKENAHRRHEQFWEGADLVVEIVSPDDPERDTIVKREEYAQAGIREYWIVHPLEETVTVLTLAKGESAYREHGVFTRGQVASSVLLEGFSVEVAALFADEG